ncbi:trimeric LpxA-like protein [Viridothelium virens]|uniref:Dynactin subunit 5 n=1 Tax=Viridothelium virens TaxID=1048519 RepID=A0A6A6H166_VIRVR|nr:trimeric LpxA-like protein [Viridothelium virens]
MSRPSAGNRKSTAGRSIKGEYIETDTGNKVSRRAKIEGTPNIMLAGRTVIMADVHLRGDLHRTADSATSSSNTTISMGKYTVIATGCTIHPPSRLSRGIMHFYPVKIGDHVYIGPECHVSSISIASHVHIGPRCVLGPFSIVKENVRILDGAVVPQGMVIPPGVVVGGSPARVVGEVPEGWGASGRAGETVEGGELRELVRSIRG